MKLIDNKGKLFGKINIIDLVVLISILGILAFGIKAMMKDYVSYYIIYDVCGTDDRCDFNAPGYLTENIKKGDILVNDEDKAVGIVEDVMLIKTDSKNANNLYLLLKFILKGNKYKDQNLAVGSWLWIKTKTYSAKGMISYISKKQMDLGLIESKKSITLRFRTADKELMKKISTGDTMKEEAIRESKGDAIAEITNITVKDIERVIITEKGEVFVKTDPLEKEILLGIDIKTFDFRDKTYFNRELFELGNYMKFNFGDYVVSGEIFEID
jgi:hypothetical protein